MDRSVIAFSPYWLKPTLSVAVPSSLSTWWLDFSDPQLREKCIQRQEETHKWGKVFSQSQDSLPSFFFLVLGSNLLYLLGNQADYMTEVWWFCYFDKTKTCPKVSARNMHTHMCTHTHIYIYTYAANGKMKRGRQKDLGFCLQSVSITKQACFWVMFNILPVTKKIPLWCRKMW